MTTNSTLLVRVRYLLQENLNTSRWCLEHLEDREAPYKLRQASMSVSALSLALDYEMEGRHEEALHCLQQADWTTCTYC